MNFLHQPSRQAVMPDSHQLLWKYLYKVLPNETIVAGSFAAAQMRHNLTGEVNKYNDIDFWYDETPGAGLTPAVFRGVICK